MLLFHSKSRKIVKIVIHGFHESRKWWNVKSRSHMIHVNFDHDQSLVWSIQLTCDWVVISIAKVTLFCNESLVLWSTGSTDLTSMEVTTRLLAKNLNSSLGALPLSSTPKTADLIILAECLWKSSKLTELTAPLILEAIAMKDGIFSKIKFYYWFHPHLNFPANMTWNLH